AHPDFRRSGRDSVGHAAVGNRGAAGDFRAGGIDLDQRAAAVYAREVAGAGRVEEAVRVADETGVLALFFVGPAEVDERLRAGRGDDADEEAGAGVDDVLRGRVVILIRDGRVDLVADLGQPLGVGVAGVRRVVRLELGAGGQGDALLRRWRLVLSAAGGGEDEGKCGAFHGC